MINMKYNYKYPFAHIHIGINVQNIKTFLVDLVFDRNKGSQHVDSPRAGNQLVGDARSFSKVYCSVLQALLRGGGKETWGTMGEHRHPHTVRL